MQIIETSYIPVAFRYICVALVLAASLHDIVARTIPNGLILLVAAASIVTGALGGYLVGSLLAGAGVFIVAAFCWRLGWMGGGDVKLLGAATFGVPISSVFTFVTAVAVAGGLLALLYLAARRLVLARKSRRPVSLFARALRVERWRISRGGPLPYACAIAAGVLYVNVLGSI